MPGNTISKVTAAHRSVLDDLLCRVRRFFALHLFAFRGALYTHLTAHSRRTYMHIFCLLSICDITKFAESQFIYNRGCFSSVRIGSSYRLERKGARSGSERCIPSKYTIDPKIISNIQFLDQCLSCGWAVIWTVEAETTPNAISKNGLHTDWGEDSHDRTTVSRFCCMWKTCY